MDSVSNEVSRKLAEKKYNNRQLKKKPAPKFLRQQNDIFITAKSNFKAQHKQCEDLLNSGIKEIYLHCMGNAINRGINLALHIINNSNNTLSYTLNTSTIKLIDELHPLCDNDDIDFQSRNNSALHIRIWRIAALDVDAALQGY